MAKSNHKKIQFYQHKIYSVEAQLMSVMARYNELPKGVMSLDKGRSNHLHRLREKMHKLENEIKAYQELIKEAKAI